MRTRRRLGYPRSSKARDLANLSPQIEIANYYAINLHVALLRTCKFFLDEASPMLYGGNSFITKQTPAVIPLFFKTIGPFACASIRHLDIASMRPLGHFNHLAKALPLAPWLQRLDISYDVKKNIEVEDAAEVLAPWMKAALAIRAAAGESVGWEILQGVTFYRKPIFSETAEEEDLDAYLFTLDVRREVRGLIEDEYEEMVERVGEMKLD